ncbi:MAG: hypothetical protein ACYTG0_47200, partial [Planctomycetota bacterium]
AGGRLDDEVVAVLGDLPNLERVYLEGIDGVTDTSLVHLKKTRNLRTLVIHSRHVTDLGLEHLAELTELDWLYLGGTAVTDAGLQSLADLRKLRRLDLDQTNVTAEGVKKLQEALPDCEILY